MCAECTAPLEREIERLRRLTEQQADELAQTQAAAREQEGVITRMREERGAHARDCTCWDCGPAWFHEETEAHTALDDAHTPRERDGRTLTLAERIAAALPPLPEPAGEWCANPKGTAFRQRRLSPYERIVAVAGDPEDWHLLVRVPGEIEQSLTRAAVERRIGVYRLALGPAGIPPTEVKP